MPEPRRGEIWMVDWSPGRGSEQTGRRPALVVQLDAANLNPRYPNTILVAISTKGKPVPFHIRLDPSSSNGLSDISYAKCEQIMTCSKDRLETYERPGKRRLRFFLAAANQGYISRISDVCLLPDGHTLIATAATDRGWELLRYAW